MYTALVQRFKDAQTAAAAAYLEVVAVEAGLFPNEESHPYRAAQTRSEYSTERELADFCSRLSHVLVIEAVRRFSPPGGRLDIDDKKELENASVNISGALKARKCPDFDAFWAVLSAEMPASASAWFRLRSR